MSIRSKKPKASPVTAQAKEEKPQAPEKVELARPKGPTPSIIVTVRHEGEMITRAGRGFSFGELRDAALPLMLARRWNVPVDLRRRSTLAGNVQALKKWHEHAPKFAAAKAPAQKEPKEHKETKAAPKREKPKKPAPKKRAAAGKKAKR